MAQSWDASAYVQNGRFVAEMAGEIVRWLDPQPNERIVDLGCGDGRLTKDLGASGAKMTGIDSAPAMLEAARALNVNAVEASLVSLSFEAYFDAAFSNAALHWVPRELHPQMLSGVYRALKPGGRFVAEMGGMGNIAAIRVALSAVMAEHGIDAEADAASFYPSPAEYRALLTEAGFEVERMELAPRPTPLPNGMEGWLRTFRNGVLSRLDATAQEEALRRTVELLRPSLCDSTGSWVADYVRLRFAARRG